MTRARQWLKSFFVILLLCTIWVPAQALPQEHIIIRDSEIENTLKDWMAPLLEAADMGPDSVHLILVQNSQINAFVAGGANIFIYTGLIESTNSPGELIGVLAHELGHIAGGHLLATYGAHERASYEAILGTIIGIGVGGLTGDGAAAGAIISGTRALSRRKLLAHSRVNESSADQAALRFMEEAEIDPKGLESFFEELADQELLPANQQSEYQRTHPLTRNRIESVKTKIKNSAHYQKEDPPAWREQHARMKAKLMGFINPGQVTWTYNDRDKTFSARYARAIAAYKQNNIQRALRLIDALIKDEPDNAYLYELKGQMLIDFGRIQEALIPLEKAVDLDPNAGLLRIMLAHAYIEIRQGDDSLKQAIGHLERALHNEPRSARVRRLMGTAYGRLGDDMNAKLHLAEEAAMQGRIADARRFAKGALKASTPGSRTHLQAQDLLTYLEAHIDDDE